MKKKKDTVFTSRALKIIQTHTKEGTWKDIWEDWKWIFKYTKRYKWAVFIYILFGMLSTTLAIAGAIASKYMIDIITGYKMERLGMLIAIMIGSMLASLLFTSLTTKISVKISVDINNDIQKDIFEKIMDSDWMELNQYASGDILNRFNNDIHAVSSNAISWLPDIFVSLYNFIVTFFVIWYYNHVMAYIAFLSAPFLLLSSRFFIRKQRQYNMEVRKFSSDMMTFEVESFYNLDTIKSFGIMDTYTEKLKTWQKNYRTWVIKYNDFSILTNAYMKIVAAIVEYASFGYCLYLMWSHLISYGTMILFLQQRSSLSNAFNKVVAIVPSFLNSSVSAHRIRELVELKKENHIKESHALDAYADKGYSIQMDQVDFAYKTENKVISNSYFQANPGEIVALVGPSGEGKTTMLRLILGLISPDKGNVSICSDNKKVCVPANADSRHLFSYVPQGNTILSGTIAENLRMVKPEASEKEMIEALKISMAWDFVSQLEHTIHSAIGERGKGFSEGQAQRIAIARAILRDAPILLLDEATSALDVTTERQVLQNIVKQCPNKTIIVTTHRPSVLNLCKRVYRVIDSHVVSLSEEESAQMVIDF